MNDHINKAPSSNDGNPALGKSLQFTNGTTNTVEFGEFNARTEILIGDELIVDGKTYYTDCTVYNSDSIQRIQLVQPVHRLIIRWE